MNNCIFCRISALVLLVLSFPIMAKEEPLWEIGAGAALFTLPHYPGSDQETTYLLPLPYFVYRGDWLQADRSGIRSFLYNSERLDVNLSFGGSLPVNNNDNDARKGMDNLDLLVEVGPTIQYTLYENSQHLLRFDVPVRAAFTLGSEFLNHQGWTSNPRLYYNAFINDWEFTATVGALYSDSRYHGYYYNVNSNEVTPARAFYRAQSGLTANRLTLGLKKRIGKLSMGTFFQYLDLNDASNNDSPLVRQEEYLSASLFVAWVFGTSAQMVGNE